jgi:hypothetical protein
MQQQQPMMETNSHKLSAHNQGSIVNTPAACWALQLLGCHASPVLKGVLNW